VGGRHGEVLVRQTIIRSQLGEVDQQRLLQSVIGARHCAMEKVWTCASNNILIAPPTNPVTHMGWEAIKRNWEAYWPTFSQFSVSMIVARVNVNGPVAWVHGIETSRRRSKSGEVTSSRNYGTNIFVNHGGSWLLEFHQSALIPES
jgi:hypothetical protein